MALILMKQIIVLFLMMGCGLAVVKLGMLKVEDSKALSVVSLYLLLPSVVIHSFDIEYTPEVMSGFLLALAAALAFHGILFVICTVLSSTFHLGAVEKCSLIYTNAGNIIMKNLMDFCILWWQRFLAKNGRSTQQHFWQYR